MHTVSKNANPIGAGGFGAVYTVATNEAMALKVVKNNTQEHTSLLEDEFDMMNVVYDARLNTPQIFQIPLPIAYLPVAPLLGADVTALSSKYRSKVKVEGAATILRVETVEKSFLQLESSNSVYAMERIPSLPLDISQKLLQEFSPKHLDENITLCRLYFGKESPINRSRFFNSRNFPIDLSAYAWLSKTSAQKLPTAATIASEMGRMLSTIHQAGFDGRDIEFVLAGCTSRPEDREEQTEQMQTYNEDSDPANNSWACYTFDFNQMRRLSGVPLADVALLTESFFLNDPYYPRPRPASDLYQAFKAGYHRTVPSTESQATANRFFEKLESEQTRKDQINNS